MFLAGNVICATICYASLSEKRYSYNRGAFRNAEEVDTRYILALNADRLLAPYLREAGLTPKMASYPNWENTGLDGHIGGIICLH
ncbi:glycoside hydrolase family 127 protein [Niabella hibiscisoli]|uniref:glycoside hydrolase family 127 protein n=1 Tax=Niabella hibiscisoli TaxID=1825928 RepID=UPI001F101F27|nr:glycoside hydrolase family 127 protein [Niabella hibiscisoli]MCH5717959.1 glycoside hydrolase family 127 protein [Niabella hibiscisoli]